MFRGKSVYYWVLFVGDFWDTFLKFRAPVLAYLYLQVGGVVVLYPDYYDRGDVIAGIAGQLSLALYSNQI